MFQRNLKASIIRTQERLDEVYKPTKERLWLKLAGVTVIATIFAQYYLWVYYDHLNIDYSSFFDSNDVVRVLNKVTGPLVYVVGIMFLFSFAFIPIIIKAKRSGTEQIGNPENLSEQGWMGLSNLAVILLVLLIPICFYVFLSVYKFSFWATFLLLFFTLGSCYLFLRWDKNLGVVLAIFTAFVFTGKKATKDVEEVLMKKEKSYIMVKNYSDIPVLTQESEYRYLIAESTDFKFILDECEKKIYAFSETTGSLKIIDLTRNK